MKRIVIASVMLMLLSGCATHKCHVPDLDSPPSVLHRPVSVVMGHKKPRLHQPRGLNNLAHKHSQPAPVLTDGFARVAYHLDQQPIIQTAPFQITVIQLEPGEQFTNISSGDPTRWSYAVAVSGKEEKAQQNILVKPSLPDIQTNLVITTDKRLYNLHLFSTQTDQLTRQVSFGYPEDASARWNSTSVEATPLDVQAKPNPLHDHYRITTAGFFNRPPAWQPIRVFDDGVQTTIQFPNSLRQRDLPTFFVLEEGQKVCVNYRFKAPYLIVDKIFAQATLVSGVGGSQQAVILTNLDD